ncbi:caspase family protein [Nostoc linckia FACHB-104]|nr:caspase family protein [Nostoc linckia FACHB-104]
MVKVALLIGVSEYEPGLNPLPAAVKDVDAIQQVLVHPEIGGFATADIEVLKNPQRQEMEEAIENLFTSRQRDDLLLLFFSGHGIKDDTGRLYLATRSTRKNPKGDLIRSSAVAASFVHDSMSRSRSKRQVVILDSCFSGAFAEGLSAKDDGTVNIREQLGGEGRAVLTSSSSTQYSFEQEGSDLSIYTRYLIEGITTGVADLDDDGVISIDELHEYASTKVREIQPAMKPEIYAIREGFKIRLTKVPPGDPIKRYRKEVARYMKRGEISFIGRQTLDVLRIRLGLSEMEAAAIEDETLAVARQEFQEKLQQYQLTFTNALQQEVVPSEEELNELRQNLQQILGLRNEDTMLIESKIKAQIATYKQHLQQYEQVLTEAMRKEYPLSQTTRNKLQQIQQQWQLTNEDLAKIARSVAAEVEAYRQKLQQYEQVFTKATQQQYPLTAMQRNELRQEQQNLGLNDTDIAPIETRINAEIEAHQQKLQQYEQVFNQEIQHEYPLREEAREDLRRFQNVLELSNEEVARIEEQVVRQKEAKQAYIEEFITSSHTAQSAIIGHHNPKTRIIPDKPRTKILQLPLQWIVPLILVTSSSLFGYFLMRLRSPLITQPVASNPDTTVQPTPEPSSVERTLNNLSQGWVIETTREIANSKQKFPNGTYFQVIDQKPIPNSANKDSLVTLQECPNPDTTPPPKDATASQPPKKTLRIELSKLQNSATVLQPGETNLCEDTAPAAPVNQPPVTTPQ